MTEADGQTPSFAERQGLTADPRFLAITRRRARFAWTLTAAMVAIFFGYILLVAFRPDLLARPIGSGVTSIGIPFGIGVIISGVVLTGIYVRRANELFDPAIDALRREYGE
jgi:Predicted membrane protein